MELELIGKKAKEASYILNNMGVSKKNEGLFSVCNALNNEAAAKIAKIENELAALTASTCAEDYS